MTKKLQDEFVAEYALTKMIRVALLPTEKTKEWMAERNLLGKEQEWIEKAKKMQAVLNNIHIDVIQGGLANASLTLESLQQCWEIFNRQELKVQDKKKQLTPLMKGLRAQLLSFLDIFFLDWLSKYKDFSQDVRLQARLEKTTPSFELLFKSELWGFLDYHCPESRLFGKTFVENFSGKKGFFNDYNVARKLLYSPDKKSGSIATRAIDDNLEFFMRNIQIYSRHYTVISLEQEETEIFELKNYSLYLCQRGIEEYNQIVGKINKKVNLYVQKNGGKFQKLQLLHKQLLLEEIAQATEQDSFTKIETREQVFPVAKHMLEHGKASIGMCITHCNDFFQNQEKFNLEKVYIKIIYLNKISHLVFRTYGTFKGLLKEAKVKEKNGFISFADIKNACEKVEGISDFSLELYFTDTVITAGFVQEDKSFYANFLAVWKLCLTVQNKEVLSKAEALEEIMDNTSYTNKVRALDNERVEIEKLRIQEFAESASALCNLMRCFALEKDRELILDMEACEVFYGKYNPWRENDVLWKYCNALRNFLTQTFIKSLTSKGKEAKFRLQFENPSLLGGWHQTVENVNGAYLFRKEGQYFLGIAPKGSKNLFHQVRNLEVSDIQEAYHVQDEDRFFEKLESMTLNSPGKALPQAIFSKSRKDLFNPSEEILRIRENKEYHNTSKVFSSNSLYKLIDFYKECLNLYPTWKCYDFSDLKEAKEYESLKEFCDHVEVLGSKVEFRKVSHVYIMELVEAGDLYLFQLHAKKDRQTQYWDTLFSAENLKEEKIRLSGGGQVFFRPALFENKRTSERHRFRYSRDTFSFNIPITLNPGKPRPKTWDFNKRIQILLSDSSSVHIIGVDLSENGLVTLCIMNENGKIVDAKELSHLGGKNYAEILKDKSKSRKGQRQGWQTIQGIKDLKKGYMDLVLYEMTKIIWECIKNNIFPMVVLENLQSKSFVRSRQGYEQQIYRRFQESLLKRLEYFTFQKEIGFGDGLQLVPKIESTKDISVQTGLIFQVPSFFNSLTCPCCGFRKKVKFHARTKKEAVKLLKKLDLTILLSENIFTFQCLTPENNKKENKDKSSKPGLLDNVTLNFNYSWSSNCERIKISRTEGNKSWKVEPLSIFISLKELLEFCHISLQGDIAKNILAEDRSRDFYKELFFLLERSLISRNTDFLASRDFVSCPSCGFHSERDLEGLNKSCVGNFSFSTYNPHLNGAVNTAKKGHLILRKLNYTKERDGNVEEFDFGDMVISFEEWDKILQIQNT